MNPFGRIALCGAINSYNDDKSVPIAGIFYGILNTGSYDGYTLK